MRIAAIAVTAVALAAAAWLAVGFALIRAITEGLGADPT